VQSIKPLKTPPQKFDHLSISECINLLDNTKGDLHGMILLGLNTGLRFGEIIALTWKNINFGKKELYINKSISKRVLGSTKSNRNRYIPMSPQLYEMLKNKRGKNILIFSENEKIIDQSRYCKLLHKACKQSDLRLIGWHLLRHTFASHLVQKGVPMKAIQELLGHSNISTTMRYAHLGPSDLQYAVDVLSFGQYTVNPPNFTLKIKGEDEVLPAQINANIKQKQAPEDLSL